MPDGALVAKRDAPVGGQAVLEGVMMRGISVWAVAVRSPEGQIEVETEAVKPWAERHRVWRLPVKPLAHLLMGALDEAAMLIARSEGSGRRAEVSEVLLALLDGLAARGEGG